MNAKEDQDSVDIVRDILYGPKCCDWEVFYDGIDGIPTVRLSSQASDPDRIERALILFGHRIRFLTYVLDRLPVNFDTPPREKFIPVDKLWTIEFLQVEL